MHMIGHHFYFIHVDTMFRSRLVNDFLEAFCNLIHEHLASILGTPNHMILATVGDIVVAFERTFRTHVLIIQIFAIMLAGIMSLRNIAPYIPTAEAGGFTARFGKLAAYDAGLVTPRNRFSR